MNSLRGRQLRLREVLVAVAAALALALVPQATSAGKPLLVLGPITIANGTAVVSGTVGGDGAFAALKVNGRPLALDANGHFAAAVPLRGATALDLALMGVAGDLKAKYTIPLTGSLLTLGGVIADDVLAALDRAGISLSRPILGGNGSPVTVSGSVGDPGQLATLRINGVDVLGKLTPGGSFSIPLPGTTHTVTLVATDRHGVSFTSVERVGAAAAPAATVSAAQAVGLRITGLRYLKKGVLRTRRIRMIVAVTDSHGRLVRGARVIVRSTKGRRFVRHPRVTSTGQKGRATVFLRLRNVSFGKRLFTLTVVKTPTAKASKKTSVRVPRRHHSRH